MNAIRCQACNGHGYVYRCKRCGTLYAHVHKYSDCDGIGCDGEESDELKCETCQGTGEIGVK